MICSLTTIELVLHNCASKPVCRNEPSSIMTILRLSSEFWWPRSTWLRLGSHTKLSSGVRFAAKTLSGYPSILAGVVTYGVLVIVIGVSAISGAVALSLLMLPTIILTSEEAIRMVPARIREAAIGMGATRTQTVVRVMLPTAFPGILTGVMLAVARAAGETAPLLFTAGFDNFWPISLNGVSLNEPTASLAVFIYNYSKLATANSARSPGLPPWCLSPWYS